MLGCPGKEVIGSMVIASVVYFTPIHPPFISRWNNYLLTSWDIQARFVYFQKMRFVYFQEISNGWTQWTGPEKTWVCYYSSSNLLSGQLVRSHSIFDGLFIPMYFLPSCPFPKALLKMIFLFPRCDNVSSLEGNFPLVFFLASLPKKLTLVNSTGSSLLDIYI